MPFEFLLPSEATILEFLKLSKPALLKNRFVQEVNPMFKKSVFKKGS